MSTPDQDAVMEFAGQVGAELAAASSVALAVLGDRLGLYRALAEAGPATASALAARTGCAERYVREWLANQAAGRWVDYDANSGRFSLPAAHRPVLADDSSPAFLLGSAQVTAAMFAGLDQLSEAFRTGRGIPWEQQHADLHEGGERFFRTACGPYLPTWIAALDGLTGRLQQGGHIVDLGCGRGWATRALAEAFPRARVTGVDAHEPSVEQARLAADQAGLAHRTWFVAMDAGLWQGPPADLVCLIDCLHDMGDPVAVTRAALASLTPGGAVLLVEPWSSDRLEDNLNWVGRAYYAGSTAFCTPAALAQDGGWALGNQAGEARLRDVLARAGAGHVQRVDATPFQLVLEARPAA
jgi:2-polyprenyl-3-methyl-5-hydroxy-6-metoxy-1,4-benzoquinol methylase